MCVIVCVCMCVSVCLSGNVHVNENTCEGQLRILGLLELESQVVVSSLMWVLGADPWSFGRAWSAVEVRRQLSFYSVGPRD